VAQICTKSFSGWGFAPDPTAELITLPRPPKGEKRRRGGQGKGGKRKEGEEGKGKGDCLLLHLSLATPLIQPMTLHYTASYR